MRRIDMLRDRHRGGRCVIVANGPSLNRMALGFLQREVVIGMNKIHLGFERFGFFPRYYVAVNPTVVSQSLQAIRALNCCKFIGSRAAREAGLQENALTYVLNTDHPPARFCADIGRGIHEGWTVTYAALQIAYFLGFVDVVLVGLDHRYAFQGAPNAPAFLDGEDPNHFDGAYFGHGQRWDNPDLVRSEESYRMALEVFQADGRTIRDATLGGACKVFPKVDYRAVFDA